MATSAAERQRRSRAHRAGDHGLCDPRRCDAVVTAAGSQPSAVSASPGSDVTPAQPDAERAPGGIETAVRAFVVSLKHSAGDPRLILGEVAVQLARRVDETGALPAAVRELRVLLAQLAEVPGQPAGPVDELRVRRAQRRLDQIVAAAG